MFGHNGQFINSYFSAKIFSIFLSLPFSAMEFEIIENENDCKKIYGGKNL